MKEKWRHREMEKCNRKENKRKKSKRDFAQYDAYDLEEGLYGTNPDADAMDGGMEERGL